MATKMKVRKPRAPNLQLRMGNESWHLPTFQNVVAGGTAYLDLEVGMTYASIDLIYGGTTFDVSKINAIRVLANKQPFHNISGTWRDTLNQFDKLPAASTYKILTIPFRRNDLRDGSDLHTELATLIPCLQAPRGIHSLRIEVDIDASAVAPTLDAIARVRDNNARLARALLRTETFTEAVPATGAPAIDYQMKQPIALDKARPFFHRIAMNQADTEITKFRMQLNRKDLHYRTSKYNEHQLSKALIRTPQSGYVIFDTAEDGYSHPIRLAEAKDFVFYIAAASGNYNLTFVYESLGWVGEA